MIRLGKLGGHHKLSNELEISPAFNYAHGTILFSAENPKGTGEFVSLALIDGWADKEAFKMFAFSNCFVRLNRFSCGTTWATAPSS